jgi:hypothetical protein
LAELIIHDETPLRAILFSTANGAVGMAFTYNLVVLGRQMVQMAHKIGAMTALANCLLMPEMTQDYLVRSMV